MNKPILFFAETCPDTAPFVAELKRLNVDYESVEMLSSLANFKQFLRLRDKSAVFDNAKAMAMRVSPRYYCQMSK